jgi:hypothetical protein
MSFVEVGASVLAATSPMAECPELTGITSESWSREENTTAFLSSSSQITEASRKC